MAFIMYKGRTVKILCFLKADLQHSRFLSFARYRMAYLLFVSSMTFSSRVLLVAPHTAMSQRRWLLKSAKQAFIADFVSLIGFILLLTYVLSLDFYIFGECQYFVLSTDLFAYSIRSVLLHYFFVVRLQDKNESISSLVF